MQFLYVTIAVVLAPIVAAQNSTQLVSQLPTCAYTCLVAAGQSGGCPNTTDFSCFCGENKDAIIKSAVPCIAKGCSTVDALSTQKIASQICKAEASVISSIVAAASTNPAAMSSSLSSVSVASVASTSLISSLSSTTSSTVSTSTTLASSATGSGTTTSASAPAAQTSSSIGPRLDPGGVVAGAALLAVFTL